MPTSAKPAGLLLHSAAALGLAVVLSLLILNSGHSESSWPTQAAADDYVWVLVAASAPTATASLVPRQASPTARPTVAAVAAPATTQPAAAAAAPTASVPRGAATAAPTASVRATPTPVRATQTLNPVAFTIVDRLGPGQTADHFEVRAGGRLITVLDLDIAHPSATAYLTATRPGRYTFTLDATTSLAYRGKVLEIPTHGEASVDIADGTELEVVVDGDYIDANGNLSNPPNLSLIEN